MSDIKTFFAMVIYLDHDGAEPTQDAVVRAPDERAAVDGLVAAVRDLPNCASVIGGMIAPLPDDTAPDAAPNAQGPNAQGATARPAGHTLH